MSRALVIAQPQPRSVEEWVKHFIDHHPTMPDAPSPDEIKKYPQALWQMLRDHDDLHLRFYTGHEHKGHVIVPGRTK